jgi:hypothetical protein
MPVMETIGSLSASAAAKKMQEQFRNGLKAAAS